MIGRALAYSYFSARFLQPVDSRPASPNYWRSRKKIGVFFPLGVDNPRTMGYALRVEI